jgi:hypothetical protein
MPNKRAKPTPNGTLSQPIHVEPPPSSPRHHLEKPQATDQPQAGHALSEYQTSRSMCTGPHPNLTLLHTPP